MTLPFTATKNVQKNTAFAKHTDVHYKGCLLGGGKRVRVRSGGERKLTDETGQDGRRSLWCSSRDLDLKAFMLSYSGF